MPLQVILTVPTHTAAELEAEYVQMPSADGSMGVLINHAPLRCVIVPGVVMIRAADRTEKVFAVSNGVAIIRNNEVSIMVDSAEPAESIDAARAEAARDRAHERLAKPQSGLDLARAEAALRRAMARLKAVEAAQRHAHH